MKYWLYVATLVGCRYDFDDVDPCVLAYASCPTATPAPPTTIDGIDRIDTDTDPRCLTSHQPDGPDLCTIFVAGLKIAPSGEVIATGSRPLFFLANGDVSIEGSIDVSSHHGAAPGAGATWASALPICAPARLPDPDTGGGGGAAGGSFGGRGGAGGAGNSDGPNAVGGQTNMTDPAPLVIRGGCLGGVGGVDGSPTSAGVSGAAGGAVYIAAANGHAIFVAGTIAAGGEGGGGGGSTTGDGGAGAGGGGAGGMIALEATTITISSTAILAANGGGGGAGGGTMVIDGADATADAQRAPGAMAVSSGGAGGAGGAGVSADGEPAGPLPLGGGGGGGGGVGVIRLHGATTLAGTISPPPD